MNEKTRGLAAALLMSVVWAGASAQVCRDDIAPTAPAGRFTDNGDGTVSDAATGLIWKQCAEGLGGAGCATGAALLFNWQGALQGAAAAEFAGYGDWRLPSKNELESLVERRCYDPAINAGFFPNTPSSTSWSSSPNANFPDGAWSVNFAYGYVDSSSKTHTKYVRLVRGGQ